MFSPAKFVVRCAELLEAEGRSLRTNAIHIGLALACILTASLTAVLAIGFIMGAIFSALRQADVGPAMSSLVCGAICIAVAAALVWTGRSMVK